MPNIVRKGDTTSCGDIQDVITRTFYVDFKEVAVVGDNTLGHANATPTTFQKFSSTFFVDNKAVGRVGDDYIPHNYVPPIPSDPHALVAAPNSATFSVDDGSGTFVLANTITTGEIPKPTAAASFGVIPETFPAPVHNKVATATVATPKNPNKQSSMVSQNVKENEQKYIPYIAAAEKKYGLPTNLLYRLLKQESSFRSDIINGTKQSGAGAIGIAQFLPDTAKELGIDPTQPIPSIDAAARYLINIKKYLASQGVPTSWDFVVAGYNAGQGNVVKAYREAQAANNTKNWLAYLPRTEETIPYVRTIVV